MRTLRTTTLCAIAALVAAGPLLAHHEWPVDQTRQVTVQGIVTAFTWANPHVMIALDVQADGTIEKWKVGGSSPKFMATCGWDKKTLKAGDVVTVVGYRFKDGSNAARLQTLVMPNGKEMYYGAPTSAQCVPRGRETPSTGGERRP
ncbi:MAG TPA: DUF6152 family protein [Vicinamibacterales bacterium]|nr:DUF6152 family protein [Vicinamibacterales bacterium]